MKFQNQAKVAEEGPFKSKLPKLSFEMKQKVTCTVFGHEVPLIKKVGMQLPASQQQSANVERVCKANQLIHTKARNRLHLPVIQMLLYVYVNLRLMNKISAEMGDEMGGFLVDTLSNFEQMCGISWFAFILVFLSFFLC